MPVASQIYKKRIVFPAYPEEAYVVAIVNPKSDLFKDAPDLTEVNLLDFLLSKVIVEWNFTDENKQVLPITLETVSTSLSGIDKTIVSRETGISELFTPAKKNT